MLHPIEQKRGAAFSRRGDQAVAAAESPLPLAEGSSSPALKGLASCLAAAPISSSDTFIGWWQAARWPLP